MIYTQEVEKMCTVAQGVHHGCAPIPEEAKWIQAKEVKDISGFTHGVGWCAPQQGACKLSLNIKECGCEWLYAVCLAVRLFNDCNNEGFCRHRRHIWRNVPVRHCHTP